MKKFILLLLSFVSISNFAFMYWLEPSNLISCLFIGGWLSLPYIVLALLVCYVTKTKIDIISILVAIIAIISFAVWGIINIVFINPDPQGALVFLFIPIYQYAAIIIVAVMFLIKNFLFNNSK